MRLKPRKYRGFIDRTGDPPATTQKSSFPSHRPLQRTYHQGVALPVASKRSEQKVDYPHRLTRLSRESRVLDLNGPSPTDPRWGFRRLTASLRPPYGRNDERRAVCRRISESNRRASGLRFRRKTICSAADHSVSRRGRKRSAKARSEHPLRNRTQKRYSVRFLHPFALFFKRTIKNENGGPKSISRVKRTWKPTRDPNAPRKHNRQGSNFFSLVPDRLEVTRRL